ncbi:MAG: hypothetical protein RJQ04_20370 [Longimicrobiales bacterium]
MSVFIHVGSPATGESQVAPLTTAQEQLDSALRAELEAPPAGFGGSGRDPSGPVLVFFGVLLVVLFGIRWLQRTAGHPGRTGRMLRLGPGRNGLPTQVGDAAAVDAAGDGATAAAGSADERRQVRRPRRKKPEPIPLPPHVAAMLARIPAPGETPEPEPDARETRVGPDYGGLDVRIG